MPETRTARRRLAAAVAAVAVAAPLALAAPASAQPAPEPVEPAPEPVRPPVEEPAPAPVPGEEDPTWCLPVSVEQARVLRTPFGNWLVVSGTSPYQNMDIRFRPVTYIRQPEYWRIEVEGCITGAGLPALDEFTAVHRVTSIGTQGIEVGGMELDVAAPGWRRGR